MTRAYGRLQALSVGRRTRGPKPPCHSGRDQSLVGRGYSLDVPQQPESLTEVQRRSGVQVFAAGFRTLSSARSVPYAERYMFLTGVYETPIEHLQRAAEDEAARAASEDTQ